MDGPLFSRGSRGRGGMVGRGARGWNPSRNKHWSTSDGNSNSRSNTPISGRSDGERWERGGHRGSGRGRGTPPPRGSPRKFPNVTLRVNNQPMPQQHAFSENTQIQSDDIYGEYQEDEARVDGTEQDVYDEGPQEEHPVDEEVYSIPEIREPEFETAEEREKFYQELVKAREVERKKAIAEGKMDDPLVPKRLEDAISVVGTCMDMCPRFERYRRERENNLFEWETILGTKRVDHNRAVKMYERAAGDKTLPSDLRPPQVLKLTLDYLFHNLLPRGGFSATFNFIRDRTRSVRNDFTMQHITGPLAIECHDRCARFHILALHFERDRAGFSIPLEEQQLMNTLQSLKEFYEDQRGRYESPTELEMRVYHRLIHIRDQKERHEDIPEYITSHPVFKLTTDFRLHVQHKSAPISKTSQLIVTEEGMQIFGQLAAVLNEQGSRVMVYLVACLLERLFGKDTIDNIEGIRGDLSIGDIIDGVSSKVEEVSGEEAQGEGIHEEGGYDGAEGDDADYFLDDEDNYDGTEDVEDAQYAEPDVEPAAPAAVKPSAPEWLSSNSSAQPSTSSSAPAQSAFNFPPVEKTAFGNLVSTPNVFGAKSIFGDSAFGASKPPPESVFGNAGSTSHSVFNNPSSISSAPVASNTTPPPFPTFQSSSSLNGFPTKPSTSAPPPPAETPSLFGNPFAPQITSSQSAPPAPSFGESSRSFFSGPPTQPPTRSSSFSSGCPSNPMPLDPKAPEFKPSQPPPPQHSLFPQPPTQSSASLKSFTDTPFSIPAFSPVPQPGAIHRPHTNGTTSSFPKSYTDGSPTPPPSLFSKPSPPTSASSTPPPNRPIAPPLLKIDTNTSSGSSTPSAAASPRVPPPLSKQQPISLPSTPTMILQPPNPLLGHLRNSLGPSSLSPSGSQEILSPLVMGSPTASTLKIFNNFTPLSTPQASRIFKMPSPSKTNGKGKAPDLSLYDIGMVEAMKEKALKFAHKSSSVKQLFRRWLKRTTDRAAYLEARKHGDEYREKLKLSHRERPQLQTSKSIEATDKKRRISSNGGLTLGDGLHPHKKRARKRISAEYRPPRTDEDLAKRLRENHREHEIRWAQGSFLQVIRTHVKKLNSSTLKLPWHIWLAMNPESDATAIWLERKFDVPDSGSWASESIFSIPLSSASGTAGYPGVIVFECTPLGDVADDLERKYRILDDCSRLREVVKALPEKRYFIPALLVICWADGEQNNSESDFFDMAKKLVSESVLQSYQVFTMTTATKELDKKLDTVLSSMNLDTEGKLVRPLSLRGAFKVFEPTFNLFLNEWMENSNTFGRFNWGLYGQVVQVAIILLNGMEKSVRALFELEGLGDPLPEFNGSQLDDSDSAYDDTMEWLSNLDSRDDARMIAGDLQAHRNIGQDFPGRIFIEHLFELTQTRLERSYPTAASNQRLVLVSAIKSAKQAFKDLLQSQQMKLLQLYNFSVRRSPKRRIFSAGTSEQGSPEAKRPRLSAASVASSVAEDYEVPSTPRMSNQMETQTPSPTSSIVSLVPTERDDQTPQVTVAMLRALTRDLKKKYGGS